MAEILALGITHYPPLTGHDPRMSGILKHMLRHPRLPPHLRDPANWPEPMRREWGDDEGTTSARAHRATLLAWLRRVRAALDDFRPDFVLIWGDDQYENFREDVVPPYCVCAYPSHTFTPPADNVWGEAPDTETTVPGHPAAGKALAGALLDAGFDTAYAYRPLHHGLGHAFSYGVYYLDYDRRGFPYPILPFAVNCYGRRVIAQRGGRPSFERELTDDDLDPPSPTPARLFDLGAQTARFLADSPWRVALLASSGWSHAFLTAKTHYLWPDTASDRTLYDALVRGDYATWRRTTTAQIEDAGQQEVLNWMCLAGALDALGRRPAQTAFVDTWIFNSSKVFLIAPP